MTEKRADNLFKIAMNLYLEKKNIMGLVSLFYGIGNYVVEAYPSAGHDYYSVLKAMYIYNSNNKVNMNMIFSNVLNEMIEMIVDARDLEQCYMILITQLKYEKQGISNVSIDVKEFLKKMCEKIKDKSFEDDNQITQIIEDNNKFIEQRYGIKGI